MFELSPTGNVLDLMTASALRARVLAANAANQNTPGYRRRDVRFEEELLKELSSSAPRPDRVQPEIVVDHHSPAKPDGNNVVLEQEMTEIRANRLLYETFATIVEGQFGLLSSAIHGDR